MEKEKNRSQLPLIFPCNDHYKFSPFFVNPNVIIRLWRTNGHIFWSIPRYGNIHHRKHKNIMLKKIWTIGHFNAWLEINKPEPVYFFTFGYISGCGTLTHMCMNVCNYVHFSVPWTKQQCVCAECRCMCYWITLNRNHEGVKILFYAKKYMTMHYSQWQNELMSVYVYWLHGRRVRESVCWCIVEKTFVHRWNLQEHLLPESPLYCKARFSTMDRDVEVFHFWNLLATERHSNVLFMISRRIFFAELTHLICRLFEVVTIFNVNHWIINTMNSLNYSRKG